MSFSGDVNLTIADGGATVISVPAARLQVVMGCCDSGTSYSILATRQPNTLLSTFGYGPMTEAAGLAINSGATVLAMKVPTTTAGAVAAKASKVVSDATNATPIVITTSASHLLVDGDVVTIAAVGGNTAANGTFVVNVLTSNTFQLVNSVGSGAYTSGGTVTPKGAIQTDSSDAYSADTSVMYLSGTAKDEYFGEIVVAHGGTVATDSIQVTISLDGGRQATLPRVTIGTATTYVIPNTGLTLNLGTGSLTAGTKVRFYTTPPLWAVADVVTALSTLAASDYAASGWGSMHLVGKLSGADAGTINTKLEAMAASSTNRVYTAFMAHARDASPPSAWGGTAETDSAWSTSVIADYSSTTAKRVGVAAGYYNIRSVYPNTVAGLPLYRRPLSWAWAARVAGQLPFPADSCSWVRLQALSQITRDATSDPTDGFVYHNEADGFVFDNLNGGAGRMTAARLRTGKKNAGWFISNEETLSTTDFQLMPHRRVMDLACGLVVEAAMPYIGERVKENPNGTIRETQAIDIEGAQERALDVGLGAQINGRTITVDRDWNIADNRSLKITGTIQRGEIVLEINETIGFGTLA